MVLAPCNATEPRQLGWRMVNGTIRATASTAAHAAGGATATPGAPRGERVVESCITAAHPMYNAVLLPCNPGDARQQWPVENPP